MERIIDKNKCCGCAACMQICPREAIQMIENHEGFRYPVIDQNLCIDCKKCLNICPIYGAKKREFDIKKCYAAQNKDYMELKNSSSGGVFSQLARRILQLDGIVVGAGFDENFELKHLVIDNEKDLYKILGSKYVESNTDGIYEIVREYLDSKKFVLFSGTPCQVNALYRYINKSINFLFTCDFVCHGVPSPAVWRKYKEEIVGNDRIQTINFREKSKGWIDFSLKIEGEKNHYLKNYMQDEYMYAFMNNWSLRKSCYQCEVKGDFRKSDFTLADFWGYKGSLNQNLGVSLIIAHTEKAMDLLNEIKKGLFLEEKEINSALSNNKVYYSSVSIPKKRALFFSYLNKNTVRNTVHMLMDNTGIKNNIKMVLKFFIIKYFRNGE